MVNAGPSEPAATSALPADPNEDLKPIAVKTVKVKASTLQSAAIGSVAVAAAQAPAAIQPPVPARAPVAATAALVSSTTPVAETPAKPAPVRTATIDTKASVPVAAAAAPQPVAQNPAKGDLLSAAEKAKSDFTKYDVVRPEPVRAEPPKPAIAASESIAKVASIEPTSRIQASPRTIRSGWIVQVGALDTVDAAKDRLAAARNKAMNLLGRADAFTETVTKGDKTLHRARFAGLDKDHAEAACKALKRADIVCMAIKN